MRYLIILALAFAPAAQAQGLLKSLLYNREDTAVVCTLSVQDFENWDKPTYHYFKSQTSTYLKAGDYLVRYKVDTAYVHSEFIHVAHGWIVLYKVIFSTRPRLKDVRFTKPRKRSENEEFLDY